MKSKRHGSVVAGRRQASGEHTSALCSFGPEQARGQRSFLRHVRRSAARYEEPRDHARADHNSAFKRQRLLAQTQTLTLTLTLTYDDKSQRQLHKTMIR